MCLALGAAKWIDFKESGDALVEDVVAAADGVGPHAALVTAGAVSVQTLSMFVAAHAE